MTGGLVVVGSGPAGLGAARAYREHGGDRPVRIVSADADLPYDRPPLSKDFLRGVTGEAELLLEPAAFYAEARIDAVLGVRAAALDPDRRRLTLDGGRPIDYDDCVLATGSAPTRLRVPGGDDPAVLHLRSLADARILRSAALSSARAVVVGSGFIGCEAAASLAMDGVAVTMVTDEAQPHAGRLGAEVGRRVAGWLTGTGVELVTGASVTSIEAHGPDAGAGLHLAGRAPFEADFVLVAVGIRPRAELARTAGLELVGGRILVDEQMRASAAGVFAAGDVARAGNVTAGRPIAAEHWTDALGMGSVAGATVAGARAANPTAAGAGWDAVPGFWSEIGKHTLKYHSWGDGYDEVRFVDHGADAFTAWYGRDGVTVGVLTSDADADYDRGRELIATGAALPG